MSGLSEAIFNVMIEKADELGVKNGACFMNISGQECINLKTLGTPFRLPDPENRGPDDQGTSYLGFGAGKVFQSMRTGRPSGPKGVLRGESPAMGSLFSSDGKLLLAFSGGKTEVIDLQIVQAGIKVYEEL